MTDPNTAFHEQLVVARRNLILDAATKVFAEKGFHRATIKDIAKAGGVADGTIYNYFRNKTDLLIALLDRLNESERREIDLSHEQVRDVRSFFTSYLRHRLSVVWPNQELVRAVLPELIANPELRDRYYQEVIAPTMQLGEQFIQAQIDQRQMRPVDASLAARTLTGSILGLLLLQLLGDRTLEERWEALPEVLATLFFDGLQHSDGASQTD